jgi:hypothetical protein
MSFTSATDMYNSMLVLLQCSAALMLTLVAATFLKSYGIIEDRGVASEPSADCYSQEAAGQDLRCLFSLFMGLLFCHFLDAEGRPRGGGIAGALRGLCAALT